MFSSQTFEVIQRRILSNINLPIQKNEGSFVYTMTSPVSVELAKEYMELDNILSVAFIKNGFDNFLDDRVFEYGVIRKQGTKAKGKVNIVFEGERSIVLNKGTIFLCAGMEYTNREDITLEIGTTIATLEAIDVGISYNIYRGTSISMQDMEVGVTSIITIDDFIGTDIESDEALRERFLESVTNPPTSGNEDHYIYWAKSCNGIHNARVIPRWNGNLTVKVILIGVGNLPVTDEVKDNTEEYIKKEMPFGAVLTVTTPTTKDIDFRGSINISEGYEIEDVLNRFKLTLSNYISTVTDIIVYSKVFGLLANLEGVEDITELTINNVKSNIIISNEFIPRINIVELTEVI